MASDKKVVIIFGATGTVGHAMLDMIVKEQVLGKDMKVVAVGNDKGKCAQIEKEFKIHTMTKDAKELKQVQEVFDMHKGEGIMSVVNLMGDYMITPLTEVDEKTLMQVVEVSLILYCGVSKHNPHNACYTAHNSAYNVTAHSARRWFCI
eukprot:GHRR01004118.1.p1 GENE.GHRR01004118.1~~GHRR01004118.1.p1  ORF type:complete len:149 (+),score=37.25 GHRR01004118.1:140-586(+)